MWRIANPSTCCILIAEEGPDDIAGEEEEGGEGEGQKGEDDEGSVLSKV